MPLVETKYFNAVIGNKPFFDQPINNTNKKPVKNLSKCHEMIIIQREMY